MLKFIDPRLVRDIFENDRCALNETACRDRAMLRIENRRMGWTKQHPHVTAILRICSSVWRGRLLGPYAHQADKWNSASEKPGEIFPNRRFKH
jgi:hypothetical protein